MFPACLQPAPQAGRFFRIEFEAVGLMGRRLRAWPSTLPACPWPPHVGRVTLPGSQRPSAAEPALPSAAHMFQAVDQGWECHARAGVFLAGSVPSASELCGAEGRRGPLS